MKKILLGLLALSAVSFAVSTHNSVTVPVNVKAMIIPGSTSLVIQTANGETANEIAIKHDDTNYGLQIQPKSSDNHYLALINGTDQVISLTGYKIESTLTLDQVIMKKIDDNAAKFNTTLTISDFNNHYEGKKGFSITSTPDANSAGAIIGTYTGTSNVTFTINK